MPATPAARHVRQTLASRRMIKPSGNPGREADCRHGECGPICLRSAATGRTAIPDLTPPSPLASVCWQWDSLRSIAAIVPGLRGGFLSPAPADYGRRGSKAPPRSCSVLPLSSSRSPFREECTFLASVARISWSPAPRLPRSQWPLSPSGLQPDRVDQSTLGSILIATPIVAACAPGAALGHGFGWRAAHHLSCLARPDPSGALDSRGTGTWLHARCGPPANCSEPRVRVG